MSLATVRRVLCAARIADHARTDLNPRKGEALREFVSRTNELVAPWNIQHARTHPKSTRCSWLALTVLRPDQVRSRNQGESEEDYARDIKGDLKNLPMPRALYYRQVFDQKLLDVAGRHQGAGPLFREA